MTGRKSTGRVGRLGIKICSKIWNVQKFFLSLPDDLRIVRYSSPMMKTKHILFQPTGVCSRAIDVTADENDVIQQVFFTGGCNGNLQGISLLVRGQKIDDVISRLQGIRCGTKGTSCPDQLCEALKELKRAPLEG